MHAIEQAVPAVRQSRSGRQEVRTADTKKSMCEQGQLAVPAKHCLYVGGCGRRRSARAADTRVPWPVNGATCRTRGSARAEGSRENTGIAAWYRHGSSTVLVYSWDLHRTARDLPTALSNLRVRLSSLLALACSLTANATLGGCEHQHCFVGIKGPVRRTSAQRNLAEQCAEQVNPRAWPRPRQYR